jgi:hypothetical protein
MGLAVLTSPFASTFAAAHVKWFCAYDVAGQPRGLENVLCPDFEHLVGLSILLLVMGCAVEGTFIGEALLRAFDRVTSILSENSELIMRAVCGAFFIALWTTGGILLTPELKTTSLAIPWLQFAMALSMLWRRTLIFAAAGIFILYGLAVKDYGVFHLMDYPVFLGVAVYLGLLGLQIEVPGLRPLDILRWTAGVTLMWASIEKWAYPQWSFPLFVQHPAMAMGFDDEFFMRAAGAVEFALAFGLVWTPLVRRVAATILAGMFISAVLEFGKIDAIGHAPIVAVLLVIIGDRARIVPRRRYAFLAPLGYAAALTATMAVYYFGHSAIFGTTIV